MNFDKNNQALFVDLNLPKNLAFFYSFAEWVTGAFNRAEYMASRSLLIELFGRTDEARRRGTWSLPLRKGESAIRQK